MYLEVGVGEDDEVEVAEPEQRQLEHVDVPTQSGCSFGKERRGARVRGCDQGEKV